MPIININGGGSSGRPPGGGQPPGGGMRNGPSSQIPFMRPNYDAAWNSNRSQPGPTAPDDYARALAQKEAQERRAAATQRQAKAQQDAEFRRSQQQADAARRVFDRTTREEVRGYEAAQRAKAKADADLLRARERNARAQEQLDRRQAADRERGLRFQRGQEYGDALHIDRARTRGLNFQRSQEYGDARAIDSVRTRRLREEAALGRQFNNLQYRAGRPLTPSAYQGVQRQASLLQGRAADYQSRYGMSPAGLGGMGGTLSGMGSFVNTYATQNIMGLGARGQRAADSREWVGLARIEQELRRIERVNVAILGNDLKSTAEQKANARRNIDAVREARGRIGAGRAGTSPLRNAVGSVIGGAGMLLGNPIADAALAAATGLVSSPFIVSGALNKAVSLSKPYYNLRESTAAIGRGGGFNSRGLLNRLLPTSGGSPAWMKAQGITTQMATGILGDYGIAPRSASEAVGVIRDVRSASLSNYMGLNDQQLARSAALARTLGVTGLGGGAGGAGPVTGHYEGMITATSDRSRYFATLQKVMASATAQGLDHADSLKTVEGLLRATAGAGAAGVNAGGLAKFWGQMTTSGLPGMRSGEGVVSALTGINQAFGQIGIGGDPAKNIMMSGYFGSHGGMPKTEASLKKFLGMSDQDWAERQKAPGHAQMVKDYLYAASRNPAFALSRLSPLLQEAGPDLMKKIYQGSPFAKADQLLQPDLMANVTGVGIPGQAAWRSGSSLAPMNTGRAAALRDRLSKDLGISRDAAAGLVGNLQSESGLKAVGEKGGGGFGFAQWTDTAGSPRRTEFEAYAKTHGGAGSDDANIGFVETELQKPQFADVLARLRSKDITYAEAAELVMKRYENPKDQSGAAVARRQAVAGRIADLPSGSDNVPTEAYGAAVNADQAALSASRYAANTVGAAAGGAPGDAAVSFSQGINTATVALEAFVKALWDGTHAAHYSSMAKGVPGGGGFSAMDPTNGSFMFSNPATSIPARP